MGDPTMRPAPLQLSDEALEKVKTYVLTPQGGFTKEDIDVGPSKMSEYEMKEALGKGASCTCKKAIHHSGTPVAMKIINITSPSKRAQIVTELRTLRDLSDS